MTPKLSVPLASARGTREFLAELDNSAHVAVYLRRALPGDLFDALRKLRRERGRGSVDIVVEDVANIDTWCFARRRHVRLLRRWLAATDDCAHRSSAGVSLGRRNVVDPLASTPAGAWRRYLRCAAVAQVRFGGVGAWSDERSGRGIFCVRVEANGINGAGLRIRIPRSRRWWGRWSRSLVGKSGTLAS